MDTELKPCFRAGLESLECTQTHYSLKGSGQTVTCRLIGQTQGWHLPLSVCVRFSACSCFTLLLCSSLLWTLDWAGSQGKAREREIGRDEPGRHLGSLPCSPSACCVLKYPRAHVSSSRVTRHYLIKEPEGNVPPLSLSVALSLSLPWSQPSTWLYLDCKRITS